MRFVIGPPPDDDDFRPAEQGWRPMREPSSYGMLAVGSLVGVPVGAAVGCLWYYLPVTSLSFTLSAGSFGVWTPLVILSSLLVAVGGLFAGLIVVHEFIHALACPGFGMTRATVIGVWPSRLMPYAGHLGEMPSWRYVVVALAPFACISLLPLAAAAFLEKVPAVVAILSTVNALMSGADFALAALIWWQVPSGGMIRNKGWETWWKAADPPGASGGN